MKTWRAGGDPETQRLQLQAYLGEYQAMMARVNFFMSLQFMPVAPLVAFLAAVAVAHKYLELHIVLLVWVSAGVTQIAILVYYFALHEVYNHVQYLETKLRPRVAALLLLRVDTLWGWERHLKKSGKAYGAWVGDVAPAIFSAVAFAVSTAVALLSEPASLWNCLAVLFTGGLLFGAALLSRRVMKVRHDFEAAA